MIGLAVARLDLLVALLTGAGGPTRGRTTQERHARAASQRRQEFATTRHDRFDRLHAATQGREGNPCFGSIPFKLTPDKRI